MTETKTNWYLYMVRCADDTIYTGISIDVQARIDKHNRGRGAKYTSTRLPVKLIYYESQPDRISAMKREIQVKRWSRSMKENLARGFRLQDAK
ncbi:MAG: GIY-YIG nuclease family protein [candidate division Zixibacteria bacterium]|nr:GIY-YIG nuclease family protein [candidate division Zixibacteria bacterium]